LFLGGDWHLTPEYIVNNWTDEELNLMIEKLSERYERQKPPDVAGLGTDTPVSQETLFAEIGDKFKVVKGA